MMTEEPFRGLLIAGSLMMLPMMLFFRLKARTRESLDRRQEGLFILLTLRPVGLATLAGFLLYLASPSRMAWAAAPFPIWLRWAGVVAGAAGGLLILWTMSTLGSNLTDTVVTREKHTLVTNGPYRWVRHPFYDSVALWLAALSFAAANWYLLAGGMATVGLLVARTAAEEERLVARFGESYRSYMNRTGRFLPRVGSRALLRASEH
jgi:protein-S-isoprenylcysteine O-methyltransferase Ste14